MRIKYLIILLMFPFWLVAIFPCVGADGISKKEPWYLSRMGMEVFENDVGEAVGEFAQEYSQYYSKDATIKYKGDIVYSKDCVELKNDITAHLKFISTTLDLVNSQQKPVAGEKKEYPNLMAVILCASGKKEGVAEPKEIFSSLRVKRESSGKYTFNRNTASKIVIFCSNTFAGDLEDTEKYTFLRKSDLPSDQNQGILAQVVNQSHTEPLGLAAILSLSPDTFTKMLGEGYVLSYYEIHFISFLDACLECPKKYIIICQQLETIL